MNIKKENDNNESKNVISLPFSNLKLDTDLSNDTQLFTSSKYKHFKTNLNKTRSISAINDKRKSTLNKNYDANQNEKKIDLLNHYSNDNVKIRENKLLLHKSRAVFNQEFQESNKFPKYTEPITEIKKLSTFENFTTSSKSSINKNRISSRAISENSSLNQKNMSTSENMTSVSNHCLIHKRYIQHALTKSWRAPLRNLLDSGGKLNSANGQSNKLSAYILSENYQERLLLLNEKTQQQIRQRDLYNQFKSKRSITFSRPIAPPPTSNPNFLITQHKI